MSYQTDSGYVATDDGRVVQEVVRPAVAREEVATTGRMWAPDSVVVGLVGVAATVVGLVGMVRAGLDGPMDEPVVSVAGFTHTATLGIIEAAMGLCLLLSAAARSRGAAIFFGLLLGIGGIVAAMQTDSFRESPALQSGWAWIAMAAAALVVVVSLLAPRMWTRRTLRSGLNERRCRAGRSRHGRSVPLCDGCGREHIDE